MNSLRSQLEKTREEKAEVEEQLNEAEVVLAQEQREHKLLQQSRAREVEQWSDERETSLSLVKEMTREVTNCSVLANFLIQSSLPSQPHSRSASLTILNVEQLHNIYGFIPSI